jgi:hypothetical protein
MNAVAVRSRTERGSVEGAERQAAVMDALADTPESVTLVAVEAGADPVRLTVYPKGYVALRAIQTRNLLIASLTDDLKALETHGGPADLDVIIRAQEEMGYQERVIAWIATTPGPGLPFPEEDWRPTLPPQFADIHPHDFYALAGAFQRVNATRLLLLDSSSRSETRPNWSVFFAMMAETLNASTAELMRDWSLASLIAQATVAAERKAKENPRQRVA